MAIRKIPADTETYKYHNENPKHKRTGDCGIRTIATANEMAWDEVLDGLTGYAHEHKVWGDCYGDYAETLGFKVQKQPRKADNTRMTVAEFCRWLNRVYDCEDVRIIANVGRGHMAAIIQTAEGYKVHDTWNSSGEIIGKYWIKH